MCCRNIVLGNLITIQFPRKTNHNYNTMVRSESTRKSKCTSHDRRFVRLNREHFKNLVEDTVIKVYGTTSIGFPRYRVNISALNSLREAAENFLTNMWNEVHQIAVYDNHRHTVERQDFLQWRSKHISAPKQVQKPGGKTLCQLFDSIKKARRHRRSYKEDVDKVSTPWTKEPLKMFVQQTYFDQMNDQLKTVEARPYYPSYREYSEGDRILFTSPSGEEMLVRIEKKSWYPNFERMLCSETVQACLPGLRSVDMSTAVNIYHNFRNKTYETLAKEYGVISFKVKLI